MAESSRDLIKRLLDERTLLKSTVVDKTEAAFTELKKALTALREDLSSSASKSIAKNLNVSFTDKGDFEADFDLVDDTMVFMRHTNVFTFEHHHPIWKSSYVQQEHANSYCGKIYVYNFLSDSFKYNRANDIGYLIARIFINRENHFFVEGKRQLGFLYNDFANDVFDAAAATRVAESILLYSLDFDPFTPPYEQMQQLTVQDILDTTLKAALTTGKRLGFRFQLDKDVP